MSSGKDQQGLPRNSPIRVALIANSFTPGGAESYLYRLYSGLAREGLVKVTLIGSLPEWPKVFPQINVGVAAKLTRQKPVLPQLRNSLRNAIEVRRELGRHDFDLVHLQYFREKLTLGRFFTRNLPVIWTEHGPLAPNFPYVGRPLLRSRAFNTRVIAVSDAVKNSLHSVGIVAQTVWNPLPEVDGFGLKGRREGEESNYVLYAGRVHQSKRLDLLLQAAALLPSLTFKIAGNGPDLEHLRGTAPENVQFLGHLDDLQDVMAGCLAVISTSGQAAREGSPMVVLEARNLGVPVLMAEDCHAAGEAQRLGAHIYSPTAVGLASEIRALGTTLQNAPLSPEQRHERGEARWLSDTYSVMQSAVEGHGSGSWLERGTETARAGSRFCLATFGRRAA